jgi:hypothetical protein
MSTQSSADLHLLKGERPIKMNITGQINQFFPKMNFHYGVVLEKHHSTTAIKSFRSPWTE